MERRLCERRGGMLSLRRGRSLDVLRSYTEQMLTGLDHLHSKSVVHKQFKVNKLYMYLNIIFILLVNTLSANY